MGTQLAASRRKSVLIIVTMVALLSVASYFGTVASFERNVYQSAIVYALVDRRSEPDDPVPPFVSRPHKCEPADTYVDVPIDPILDTILEANTDRTRPIPLASASTIVPVVAWEDAMRMYRAGYIGLGDTDVVFVSRVGFDQFYEQAVVCLTRSIAPHGWGVLMTLERDGLDWSVESAQKSSIAH